MEGDFGQGSTSEGKASSEVVGKGSAGTINQGKENTTTTRQIEREKRETRKDSQKESTHE